MSLDLKHTLVLIKPDALKQSLTGYILSTLSEFHTGLKFAGIKVVAVNEFLAEEHYAEHKGKSFFPGLVEFITGVYHYPDAPHNRRVLAFVYSGENAIKKIRDIAGPTNPHEARDTRPGTIRSLGTVVQLYDDDDNVVGDRFDNLIHASDSETSAEREVKLWFQPNEIPAHMRVFATAEAENHYYYKDGSLLSSYEAGCVCLAAPSDTMWASDLDTLKLLKDGQSANQTLAAVAAKYLINDTHEMA